MLDNGVLTIIMNRPKTLNGWTTEMMEAIKDALAVASKNDEVKVVILTGQGTYYSAGVNLGRSLKLMHPKKLRDLIIDYNQQLFESFLEFPKPILAAVNGPSIGASVTSATLCDGIIASENATFSTPFAALGVTPEGCSSVHLPRLIGQQNTERMLGKEGWKPTGAEALDIGLAQWLVNEEKLLDKAHEIAQDWIQQEKTRSFLGGSELSELKAVNAQESINLANAFLAKPFLKGQSKFFWRKQKYALSAIFFVLQISRPIWAKLLS
ncbi:enoyl-CoA hydratase/isomerase family protein [Aliikangiella marina]|nr:enoyl-CoA hydratase/isomerase family protein [Aliikangiella marina]